jgi:hypothetical protein
MLNNKGTSKEAHGWAHHAKLTPEENCQNQNLT